MRLLLSAALLASAAVTLAGAVARADDAIPTLVIEDHMFDPMEVVVPAGERVTIIVDNRDGTPEEFDSTDLKVEKVVPGHATGKVTFGPLKPGNYSFIGEFHEATAHGVVRAE